jgi:Trk K+ transport system NAD-binding subunit
MRESVIAAYHQALSAHTRAGNLPERLKARTQTGAEFFELQIPPGSIADGRAVSEIPWPEGCLVVSVHRGTSLLVASGHTRLQAGDAITAFGSGEARDRLIIRLSRTGDEPPAPQPGETDD